MTRIGAAAAALLAVGLVLASMPVAGAATVAALYHMDENSGSTANDASGNNNNGTISNVTLGVPGFSGTAYQFNNVNSIVTVPSSSSLNPGPADVELTAHIKPAALPPADSDDIIRKGRASTTGGEYKMEILPTGRVNCLFKGTRPDGTTATWQVRGGAGQPNLVDGSWHTVKCIKTAATSSVTVVVDGYRLTRAFSSSISITNSAALHLGAKAPGEDVYNGVLDEVSIEFTEVTTPTPTPTDTPTATPTPTVTPTPTPTATPTPTPTVTLVRCYGADAVAGTAVADVMTGTEGDDVLHGLGGNDSISGLGGNDSLCGGTGADTIDGGAGDDRQSGTSGNDRITDLSGTDRLEGAGGNDTLNAQDGVGGDIVDGGADTDTCTADPDDVVSNCEM